MHKLILQIKINLIDTFNVKPRKTSPDILSKIWLCAILQKFSKSSTPPHWNSFKINMVRLVLFSTLLRKLLWSLDWILTFCTIANCDGWNKLILRNSSHYFSRLLIDHFFVLHQFRNPDRDWPRYTVEDQEYLEIHHQYNENPSEGVGKRLHADGCHFLMELMPILNQEECK